MDDVELIITRSSTPAQRHSPQPTSRSEAFYYSDRNESGRKTPPPDYETFLSDNELPSARARARNGLLRQRHTSPTYGTYTSSRSTDICQTNVDDDIDDKDDKQSEGTITGSSISGRFNNVSSDLQEEPLLASQAPKRRKKERLKKIFSHFRITILAVLIIMSMVFFSINHELEEKYILAKANINEPYKFVPSEYDKWHSLKLHMKGPFNDMEYTGVTNTSSGLLSASNSPSYGSPSNCSNFMTICAHNRTSVHSSCDLLENGADEKNCVSIQLLSDQEKLKNGEHDEDSVIKRSIELNKENDVVVSFHVETSFDVHFEFSVLGEILSSTGQIILAAFILIIVYVLIIFDLVHRTIAAIIGSTTVLGVLSMLHKRPTLETTVEWISLETICLLFGMMVLVAIFSQTGFFDYFAVKAYKLSRGKAFPLISLLCLFSAVVSAFLDNVTTILLLTPVSIRLCQVLNLDPVPVLIAEVLFSNIGGTATAIGDPPNVIIVSHPLITREGVNFAEFTLHLLIGIVFCTVTAYGVLLLFYYIVYVGRKDNDPPHIAELKREIAIWERTARLMPTVSLEERAVREAIRTKAREVQYQLREQRTLTARSSMDLWRKNLEDLENRYKITDRILLIKSLVVLLVVIILFFFSHFIPFVELNLGWIAIFGALVLLLLADIQELEGVLHKVEWGTLLFFAGLFVLMEGLAELGLIDFIGEVTVNIIKDVDKDKQLLVAVILVLWVSAIVSSFIDNIPFTQAMIPVIVKLADSPEVCLPLRPLIWTLAFGACLGGNGTLIGASANVVCAGLAEQNGYRISFNQFFKMGFPMMIVTTATAMVYLIICHEAIGWNKSTC